MPNFRSYLVLGTVFFSLLTSTVAKAWTWPWENSACDAKDAIWGYTGALFGGKFYNTDPKVAKDAVAKLNQAIATMRTKASTQSSEGICDGQPVLKCIDSTHLSVQTLSYAGGNVGDKLDQGKSQGLTAFSNCLKEAGKTASNVSKAVGEVMSTAAADCSGISCNLDTNDGPRGSGPQDTDQQSSGSGLL